MAKITKTKSHSQKSASNYKDVPRAFIEHVLELRVRFTWVTLSIILFSIVGYLFKDILLNIVQNPVGQTLYYNSPVGGLNFLLKLCFSVGFVCSIPVIFYNVNKFLRPLVNAERRRTVIKFSMFSALMAILGILFAYYISMPAALNFLVGFSDERISSLLGVNEYYNFALAYLLGYAVLFQLPIIILIVNKIKPLKPSGMMKAQRWVILMSFVVAAILTPTPDPVNQFIMAGPAVLFYQIGIALVWHTNRRQALAPKRAYKKAHPSLKRPISLEVYDQLIEKKIQAMLLKPATKSSLDNSAYQAQQPLSTGKAMDIIVTRSMQIT